MNIMCYEYVDNPFYLFILLAFFLHIYTDPHWRSQDALRSPAGTDGLSSGGMITGRMEVRNQQGRGRKSWKESEWSDGSQGDVRRPDL